MSGGSSGRAGRCSTRWASRRRWTSSAAPPTWTTPCPGVHAQLGDAYRLAGRYDEALGELGRAAELAADDAWVRALMGPRDASWATGRRRGPPWTRRSASIPGTRGPWRVKANLLDQIDELDDALRTVRAAVDADPQMAGPGD